MEPEEPKQKPITFDDMGANVPTFEDYFNSKIEFIRETQAMLSEALDDDPNVMDAQARAIEGRYSQATAVLAWANSYLDVEEHRKITDITNTAPDYRIPEVEAALAAAVTRHRRFRDVLKGLCDSITQRISYAQTKLKYANKH